MSQPYILSVFVTPKSPVAQQRLFAGLLELAEDELSFAVHIESSLGVARIAVTGELLIETILHRLSREYGVEAGVDELQVIYQEAIRCAAEAEGKYIRQTDFGGCGHVRIRISPNELGAGYEFTNDIQGGVVPREYIQPTDEGIREAMRSGILAGHEMVDVRVSLYDGSYHDVASNDMAFRIAGSMAFKEAARKANPVLLEPVMSITVSSTEPDTAAIIRDLQTRRGRIESREEVGGLQTIQAAAPLADILGYAHILRELTQDRASLEVKFRQYEVRPSGWDSNGGEASTIPATPGGPRPAGPYLSRWNAIQIQASNLLIPACSRDQSYLVRAT